MFRFSLLACLLVAYPVLSAAPVPVVPLDPTKDREGNPLPNGATARLGSAGFRARQINRLSFSADGKTISSVVDGDVVTWDCESGRALVKKFTPIEVKAAGTATDCVGDLVFGLEWRRLAPGTNRNPGELVVRNRETGRELSRFDCPGYPGALNAFPPRLQPVAVSSDGHYFAYVSQADKAVLVFDAEAGKLLHTLKLNGVYQLNSIPPGLSIATNNKTLYINESGIPIRRCELGSGNALPDLDGTDRLTDWLEASPDGKWVATRCMVQSKDADGRPQIVRSTFLTIVDAGSNKAVGRLELGSYAQHFAFAGSGAVIVLTGQYRPPGPPAISMSRWNVITRMKEWEVSVPQYIHSVATSLDGKRIALNNSQVIELYDAATGKRATHRPGHSRGVAWISFGQDGQSVTTVSESGAIVWTLTGEAKHVASPLELARGNMQPCLLGDRLAWAAYEADGKTATLVGWDREKNAIGWRIPLEGPGPERVCSHDGNRAIGVWDDEKGKKIVVAVFDGQAGKKLHEWDLPDATYQGTFSFPPLTLSGDGKVLFVGGKEGVVGRDVTSGKELMKIKTGELPVVKMRSAHPLAVSLDGTRIAVARSAGKTLFYSLDVFDVKSGKRLATHDLGSMYYPALKFSPDGRRVAIWTIQGVVLVCDAESDAKPRKFDAGKAQAFCTAFSPNGATLAVGYGDGTTLLWDLTAK